MSETMIGRMVLWTEVDDPKGRKDAPKFGTRERCGVVHGEDAGGGVSVRMTAAIDPLCPPEEEGLALAIPAGSWRLAAGDGVGLEPTHTRLIRPGP